MTGRRPGRRAQPLDTAGGTVSRLGAMIRVWRDERGLSLTELATRAGFGPSGRGYLSKVEHGQLTPGQDKLTRIAAALEISVDDLLLQRLPPGATPLPSGTGDLPTSSSRNVSAPRRRGPRPGSGFVAAPKSKEDLLRDILRRTADIEALVAELLRSEHRVSEHPTLVVAETSPAPKDRQARLFDVAEGFIKSQRSDQLDAFHALWDVMKTMPDEALLLPPRGPARASLGLGFAGNAANEIVQMIAVTTWTLRVEDGQESIGATPPDVAIRERSLALGCSPNLAAALAGYLGPRLTSR